MNCKKANKRISALIDGRLAEKDRLALLEHIEVCPDCKKLYDKTKALTEKLRSLSEIPLPEGAENRIHFALEREAQKPRKKNWIKFAAIAMPATAAVFTAVFGISYLFSGGLTAKSYDATMEMAPAEGDGMMQKSMIAEDSISVATEEPEMVNGIESALEEDEAQEETLMAPVPEPNAFISVVYEGKSPDEMSAFVTELLGSLTEGDDQAVFFDEATQSIKITLPGQSYKEFMDVVESSDNLNLAETNELLSGADGEGGLLFEVNFLFQKNN